LDKVKAKSKYNHFTQWFFLKLDKNISEFNKQDNEVEALKWFSKDELKNNLKNNSNNFLKSMNEDFLLRL
jgi:isopentenyldiphosphate isomerase